MNTARGEQQTSETGSAERADSRPRVESGRLIYLDGHATTPLAPEASAAMDPWWHQRAGNPHSPHRHGQVAYAAVERARGQVAELIGATSAEIYFTSGATEANNLALIGAVLAARAQGDVRTGLVVSEIEHKSVLNAAYSLERQGFTVATAPVNGDGVIDVERLSRMVSEDTLLVSVMAANNEIGALQPLEATAEIARTSGSLLHVDAAQIVGRLPFDAKAFDYVSLSSHKMYGPMGVGALYVSSAAAYRPQPILYGGDQEGGLRPGTIATPLVVGFGAAAALAMSELENDARRTRILGERFELALRERQVRFTRHGAATARLPGSVSIAFEGIDAAELIAAVSPFISISEGSACQSGQIIPSHVLRAIGLSESISRNTVRLCFGRYNSEEDVLLAADAISLAVTRIRLRTGDRRQ